MKRLISAAMLCALAVSSAGLCQTWQKVISGTQVFNLFALPDGRTVFAILSESSEPYLLKSTDAGQTWQAKTSGLPGGTGRRYESMAYEPYSGTLYLTVSGVGLFRSSDGGETWQLCPAMNLPSSEWLPSLVYDPWSDAIFVGTGGAGIWKSSDGGNHFQYKSGDQYAYSLYAGPADASGLTGILLAGTYYRNIIRSTDHGETWENTQGSGYWVTSICAGMNGHLFAISDDWLFRSTDYGLTWEGVVRYPAAGGVFARLSYDGAGTVYASTCRTHILYTTNGTDWSQEEIGEDTWSVCALPGRAVLVGTNNGIFRRSIAQRPGKPACVSPADGATGVPIAPVLQGSEFHLAPPTRTPSATNGVAHLASQWQIRLASGTYDDVVLDTTVDTGDLTSYQVPDGLLQYATGYFWRVRYQASNYEWSEWSDEASFTTEEEPLVPTSDGRFCFVATAAFGSPDDRHTETFRRFRDRVLVSTTIGRNFTAFYYRHSPSLASFIAGRPPLRSLARIALLPAYFASRNALFVLLFLCAAATGARAALARRATG